MSEDPRKKFRLPSRYEDITGSIWTEYEDLAFEHQPIDLGQGYPDFLPPQHVRDALLEVACDSSNHVHQYTRGSGHPRLVLALSKVYSGLVGREINPYTEIVTTLGAYHAIFSSITSVVDEGDEVIIIEPFFDSYVNNVKAAGGIPRYIALEATPGDGWTLDRRKLEDSFNVKTKAIVVNTPHNPLGKVFSQEELSHIAALCKKWNVLCICDEVYEWLVYDSKKHVRTASLPGMWERTLTVGSAGKAFGVTGWKLGWVYGPDYLMKNVQVVHRNCVRAGNTFLQEVAAICFEKELSRFGREDCYFVSLAKDLEIKRNYMFDFLTEAGMRPVLAEGGYFIVADWSVLENCVDLSSEKDKLKDYRFTKWLTKNVGLQSIPLSAFYAEADKALGENFVRFCFVKSDDHLKLARDVLTRWTSKLKKTKR